MRRNTLFVLRSLFVNKYAKSALVYGLVSAVLALLPLFLLPFITRVVSVSDFGEYITVVIVVKVLTSIISLGYLESIAREFSVMSKFDFSGYFTHSVVRVFLWCLALMLLLIGSYPFITALNNIEFLYVVSLIPLAFIHFTINAILTMFQMASKPLNFAALKSFVFISEYGLILLVVFLFSPNFNALYYSFLLSSVLTFVICLMYLCNEGFIRLSNGFRLFDSSLKVSLPLVPHQLSGIFLSFSDRLLIKFFMGSGAVGVYTIGYHFGQIVSLVDTSVNKAWIPWLYAQLRKDAVPLRKISIIAAAYATTLLAFSLCVGYAGSYVITKFYPREYAEASTAVFVLALAFFVFGLYKIFASFLFYNKKTLFLGFMTPACLIFNVLLSFYLIPKFGIVGSAYATLFSFAVLALGVFLYLIYLTKTCAISFGQFTERT